MYVSSLRLGALIGVLVSPAVAYAQDNSTVQTNVGFKIPTLTDILTFGIRGFFAAAGIMALLYLLLGAFSWITSGGNKENVEKAREKIQAAIVGVILIVVVVAIAVTIETVVFSGQVCLGLTCPVSIPALIAPK